MSTRIKYIAMDVTRMTRLAHWKLYTLAENYPEYMDRYSIMMERQDGNTMEWIFNLKWRFDMIWSLRAFVSSIVIKV